MFRNAFFLLAVLCGLIVMETTMAKDKPDSKEQSMLLRHVVMFKFKDSITEAQVEEVVEGFKALPKKIDAIHAFEFGTDVSVEGKAAGFTHCFLVTFLTEKDRETYLPHSAHKDFVSLVGPRLDKVLVFDYWTKD